MSTGQAFRIATTILVVSSAATGCRRVERTPAERGRGIFLRSCAGCHGESGRGMLPPGFKVPSRNLTDPTFQARISDAELRETVRYGKGQMPPFGAALPEDDVTSVIAYVRSLGR